MAEPLLSVRRLAIDYITGQGPLRAVDGVSFDVRRGEIVGLAGESGSGKSTLAQAILRILPPPGVISGGEVRFAGKDILALDEAGLRAIRWKEIAMVFQSAMDALNPVITIGEQIEDAMAAHETVRPGGARAPARGQLRERDRGQFRAPARGQLRERARGQFRERARELLEMVGIPGDRLDGYAHQLSGGMRQRVCIAMALALGPSLLILDEPTTALDVMVEREILDQIKELQARLGFAVLFITHDLGRMLQFSDRVAVLYAARLVEIGPSAELRSNPRHPYTQGLLRAFPSLRSDEAPVSIPGAPPSLLAPPTGCRFHPRCAAAMAICREVTPELRNGSDDHGAACHLLNS